MTSNIAPHITMGGRGVSQFFSINLFIFLHEKNFCDKEGRYVMVIGSIGGIKITLLNSYVPNEDNPNFFKKMASLIDCLHRKERYFTFFSQVHCTYSRLDMFLMSGADPFRATECNIEAITISDHAPVCLKLKMSPNNNFKYWRANVSILNKGLIKNG